MGKALSDNFWDNDSSHFSSSKQIAVGGIEVNYIFNTCYRGTPCRAVGNKIDIRIGHVFVNKYTFIFPTRCDYKLNQNTNNETKRPE